MKFFNYLFVSVFFVSLFSCTDNDEHNGFKEVENRQKVLRIIKKYNLQPISEAEYKTFENTENIKVIDSPDKLELILNTLNIVDPLNAEFDIGEDFLPRIKTRSEGQSTARISGSNSNGSASVYIDLSAPAVITSTYQLGLMDAFVAYTHLGGSASRNGSRIDFTAYGQGVVKLIWEGVELYKFNSSITGYCDSNGSNGVLTKF